MPLKQLPSVYEKRRFALPSRERMLQITLAACAILIAGLSTIWYLYWATPGRRTHERYMAPGTYVRLSLQPARAQRYVSRLAPTATRFITSVPKVTSLQSRAFRVDWIHTLPYEFSLLFASVLPEETSVILFVNTVPEDAAFPGEFNQSPFFRDARRMAQMEWDRPALALAEKNVHLAAGRIFMPRSTGAPQGLVGLDERPPRWRGKHLLELSAVNRDGALAALHAALISGSNYGIADMDHAALMTAWSAIDELHLTGDLIRDDLIEFALTVHCAQDRPEHVANAAEMAAAGVAEALARQRFRFEGSGGWRDAFTYAAQYRLTGFEPALRRALGS